MDAGTGKPNKKTDSTNSGESESSRARGDDDSRTRTGKKYKMKGEAAAEAAERKRIRDREVGDVFGPKNMRSSSPIGGSWLINNKTIDEDSSEMESPRGVGQRQHRGQGEYYQIQAGHGTRQRMSRLRNSPRARRRKIHLRREEELENSEEKKK